MRRATILFLLILLMVACLKKRKQSFNQDFEKTFGWYHSSNLHKGVGHSGNYFTHTGPGQEFSQTFISKLGEITDKPIRRIDMGAWIRIAEPDAKARLVLSIESKDTTLFWQALDTEDISPKPGEWTRLYFTYDLPEGMQPDYLVKMFLWNTSNQTVDADDFDIHFYEK